MAGRPDSRTRRRIALVATGVILAGVLAAVLFTRGSGGSPDVAPGISAPAARLLTLDVFGPSSVAPAPGFTLTDQYGQAVSLSQFRGKTVVLSFNDDQCLDLCTLLAQDIVVADRDLGPARKDVVFLSVNANPFYPQVSAVRQWTDEHGLGGEPNWLFTTGTPAQIESVWKLYGAEVEMDAATRTVVHSTGLYFIGPGGHQHAFGQFGTNAADTSLFAHSMAQMAVDLLPSSERVTVGGPSVPPPASGDGAIGSRAPGFDLARLNGGGRLSLASLRGRYTVVNFWASTCTACVGELPHLEAAYKQYSSQVSFVGVAVSDSAAAARVFARRAGITYPLVADHSGVVAGAYAVPGLPFTAIVGPSGTVLVRHPGALTTEQLVYILQDFDPSLATTGSAS